MSQYPTPGGTASNSVIVSANGEDAVTVQQIDLLNGVNTAVSVTQSGTTAEVKYDFSGGGGSTTLTVVDILNPTGTYTLSTADSSKYLRFNGTNILISPPTTNILGTYWIVENAGTTPLRIVAPTGTTLIGNILLRPNEIVELTCVHLSTGGSDPIIVRVNSLFNASTNRIWYVDGTYGNNFDNGTYDHPLLTLAAALTASSDGDVIHFLGAYTQFAGVFINKALTFIAEGNVTFDLPITLETGANTTWLGTFIWTVSNNPCVIVQDGVHTFRGSSFESDYSSDADNKTVILLTVGTLYLEDVKITLNSSVTDGINSAISNINGGSLYANNVNFNMQRTTDSVSYCFMLDSSSIAGVEIINNLMIEDTCTQTVDSQSMLFYMTNSVNRMIVNNLTFSNVDTAPSASTLLIAYSSNSPVGSGIVINGITFDFGQLQLSQVVISSTDSGSDAVFINNGSFLTTSATALTVLGNGINRYEYSTLTANFSSLSGVTIIGNIITGSAGQSMLITTNNSQMGITAKNLILSNVTDGDTSNILQLYGYDIQISSLNALMRVLAGTTIYNPGLEYSTKFIQMLSTNTTPVMLFDNSVYLSVVPIMVSDIWIMFDSTFVAGSCTGLIIKDALVSQTIATIPASALTTLGSGGIISLANNSFVNIANMDDTYNSGIVMQWATAAPTSGSIKVKLKYTWTTT